MYKTQMIQVNTILCTYKLLLFSFFFFMLVYIDMYQLLWMRSLLTYEYQNSKSDTFIFVSKSHNVIRSN